MCFLFFLQDSNDCSSYGKVMKAIVKDQKENSAARLTIASSKFPAILRFVGESLGKRWLSEGVFD
jgi:hypothetical protein